MQDTNVKLTMIEKRIIRSRLDGYAISQLNESDIRWATDKIMFKGAALFGCPLPQTELLATEISKEIEVFFKENRPDLSLAEIILALRLNTLTGLTHPYEGYSDQVDFFGNQFNVMFLAKIIARYVCFRNALDSKFINALDGFV